MPVIYQSWIKRKGIIPTRFLSLSEILKEVLDTIKKKKHTEWFHLSHLMSHVMAYRLASRATTLYQQDTSLYRPTHANCHGKLIRLLYPLA